MVALQECGEYIDDDVVRSQFTGISRSSRTGTPAKKTLPACLSSFFAGRDTRSGLSSAGWRAEYRRQPLDGRATLCAMILHIKNEFAKRRCIAFNFMRMIRQHHVDIVARLLAPQQWRWVWLCEYAAGWWSLWAAHRYGKCVPALRARRHRHRPARVQSGPQVSFQLLPLSSVFLSVAPLETEVVAQISVTVTFTFSHSRVFAKPSTFTDRCVSLQDTVCVCRAFPLQCQQHRGN